MSIYVIKLIFFSSFLHLALLHAGHESMDEDEKPAQPILLFISFDGFRYDYISKIKERNISTPNFDVLINNGVFAKVESVFVTETFPNHFTMVTGMYTESHGVVANEFYDPESHETFARHKPESATNPKWWNNGSTGGETIWVTNLKAGKKSGAFFWPGNAVPVNDKYSRNYAKNIYNPNVSFIDRIDTIIEWFMDGVNLGLLYIDEPDTTGHMYGPDSDNLYNQIIELDKVIDHLIKKLNAHNLFTRTNIIISSDHGMATVNDNGIIELDSVIDKTLYNATSASPVWHIWPNNGLFIIYTRTYTHMHARIHSHTHLYV